MPFFSFFVFCSVGFLFFCLCLCMCGLCTFLCMDPSGLIQNKWNGMECSVYTFVLLHSASAVARILFLFIFVMRLYEF